MLKRNYDGYRFAEEGSEIYNPWSLLNALSESKIGNYWNDTGMSTIIAESLKRVGADLRKTFDSYCKEDDLKGLDLQNPKPHALLYQTGYLTIKDARPFHADSRKIFKIGVNFSSETRCIESWKIEEV